jgi:hypothetical protein
MINWKLKAVLGKTHAALKIFTMETLVYLMIPNKLGSAIN